MNKTREVMMYTEFKKSVILHWALELNDVRCGTRLLSDKCCGNQV